MTQISLAPSAGFCFGVNRAVNMVFDLLAAGRKVCTLGPIIHNPQLVRELEEKGVRIVGTPEEALPGELLVIRTHGVPQAATAQIRAEGLEYADATCPFVSKIHRIVQENSISGAFVMIAGDPLHPEVEGIRGHCTGGSATFSGLGDLQAMTRADPALAQKRVAVVAQTTFNIEEWQKCIEFIKKVYTNAIIFDTICDATSIRQREALKLAKESDLMLVIGGRQSSNTAKLLQVCSEHCRWVLVESAAELPSEEIAKARKIGVTAGASTPARIIKEVLKAMADQNPTENEISFEEALNQSFKTVSTGERVLGVVVGVNANEVQIDIGTKHAGYIPAVELTNDPSAKLCDLVKVGDEIDLVAVRVNDVEGTVMLSKRRVDAMKGWDEIVQASEDASTLDGTVVEVINGGMLASYKGVKVFIPASQSGVGRETSLDILLHKAVKFKIIDINTQRKRAVGSIRAAARDGRKEAEEKFWSEAQEGMQYTGTVKSLTSYGAFVDIGGVDGMIHISELSWSRIKHPSEVVKVGEEVKVTIKSLDPEKKKVSLSYQRQGRNPWDVFLEEYHVGDVIEAKVVSMMPFGAFARIIPDVDGLIHISQISERRIAKPQDVLKIGEDVKVKITAIDAEKRRISLSIREAEDVPAAQTDELGENTAPHFEGEPAPEAEKPADELGENAAPEAEEPKAE
ncbi:MAG: bifunctional 4-hydroxy-3-methylbut-2-enyl diphosphate reductase/30S ribosomal protein S1 [Clostridia bacterium]|nr:bifunctional 4-hydroxy-3-methylbut-2-enyl diphosphate reductase/30S ribosomal protein S1 [Clostridia bacterium]